MFNTALAEQLKQVKLPETPKQEIERLKREVARLKEELRIIQESVLNHAGKEKSRI